jgi:hypothetical protein
LNAVSWARVAQINRWLTLLLPIQKDSSQETIISLLGMLVSLLSFSTRDLKLNSDRLDRLLSLTSLASTRLGQHFFCFSPYI